MANRSFSHAHRCLISVKHMQMPARSNLPKQIQEGLVGMGLGRGTEKVQRSTIRNANAARPFRQPVRATSRKPAKNKRKKVQLTCDSNKCLV